jgi:branched-chain amino acid transport system substrate-binding protein
MSRPGCRALPVAAVALVVLTTTVSTASARPSSTLPPIKIAVEAPLSGSQSSNGLDMLRGVQLAVRQVNAADGVLGRRVKIIRADDKGDQSNAKRVARRVIKKKAVAVIGPYNSSVGIVNLPIYLNHRVVAVHLTSSDDTRGEGVTIQPKNSQIAPVEERYVRSTGAKRVAMLVDDTANGAFTIGMANRLQKRLAKDGVAITRISIKEITDNVEATYYQSKVAEALAASPDLVYVSTYYPEGAKIAAALAGSGTSPKCLMGLANVDLAFVGATTLAASQRCLFSGVPAAPQLPSAKSFVRRYRKAFGKQPGVWGVFTYDSARILFKAIRKAGTTKFSRVQGKLRHTKGYRGQTGKTTIDPATGYRKQLPFLSILRVNDHKTFVIAP